jgi:anti-sigma regulatory factor (Ser/Thr protein kinase)
MLPTATVRHRRLGRDGRRAPAVARAALGELADGLLDARGLDTAKLLVSELVTNCLLHGRGPGEDDGEIDLEIVIRPSRICVAVSDDGPGFDQRPEPPEPEETSGRGLLLVDLLADRWGLEAGGRRVWFEVGTAPA